MQRQRHGDKHTRLYNIWIHMKKRCYNREYMYYKYYGGKGIEVCKEWKNNYLAFKEWAMSAGYEKDMELDRKENDKNYSPDNCKWSTRTEQIRNRTNTVFVTHNGETKTLIEFCIDFGIKYKVAHGRYKKGMSITDVLYAGNLRGRNK